MQDFIIYCLKYHDVLIYLFIVLICLAEGNFISLLLGALIKLRYVHFWPVYAAVIIGDIFGDALWYYIGRRYGHGFVNRFGKYFGVNKESIAKVSDIFHKYKHFILFVSKITCGFGFAVATLVTAGMVRLPFKLYMLVNLAGQLLWTGMLIGIGYFFSNIYIEISSIGGRIFVILLFILLMFLFSRYKKYIQCKAKEVEAI